MPLPDLRPPPRARVAAQCDSRGSSDDEGSDASDSELSESEAAPFLGFCKEGEESRRRRRRPAAPRGASRQEGMPHRGLRTVFRAPQAESRRLSDDEDSEASSEPSSPLLGCLDWSPKRGRRARPAASRQEWSDGDKASSLQATPAQELSRASESSGPPPPSRPVRLSAAAAAAAAAAEADFLEAKPTRLPYDEDLYDAVLVAAFRGVTMELDKNSHITVAPVVVCALCVPLFAIQFALTIFLCLDMELDTKIRRGHADDDMEIATQLLLVVIVQLSFFHQIMENLRNLFFLLNPITWTYIDHLEGQDWLSWGTFVVTTAPFATLAIFVKFVMLYWVSTLSSSIILACLDVKDSIFNCLVISYIVELGKDMWRFACDSFSLQFEVPESGLCVRRAKLWRCPLLPGGWLHWRTRAGAEKLCATLTLFVLYVRHFIIVMWALETNVLPVARDVCSQWRWLHNSADRTMGILYSAALRWICHHLLGAVRDPLADYDRKADPEQGGLCTEEYDRITWAHSMPIVRRYPQQSITFLVALFCLLVLPAVLRKLRVLGWFRERVSLPPVVRAVTYLDVERPASATSGRDGPASSAAISREAPERRPVPPRFRPL